MHQAKECRKRKVGAGGRGWGVREERSSWGWEAGSGWTSGIKGWLPPGPSECVGMGVGPPNPARLLVVGTRLRGKAGGPVEGVSPLRMSGGTLSFHPPLCGVQESGPARTAVVLQLRVGRVAET